MEWVEVAGKTVAEATEHALDQLGVSVSDAEVIVVSEPKTGLFGRVRVEARVRARVRPVGVRPKRERSRDRRAGRNRQTSSKGNQRADTRSSSAVVNAGGHHGSAPSAAGTSAASAGSATGTGAGTTTGTTTGTSRSARRRRNRKRAGSGGSQNRSDTNGSAKLGTNPPKSSQDRTEPKETPDMAEGMTLQEQGEAGRDFLVGLLTEYGLEASVETRLIDDETVEIAATGSDLGILVGPRGSTLAALQDVTRAVVQRQCPSRTDRILVDVAGYRERRSAALKRFSTQIAQEVRETGQERALEAMSPADRKAVHDAVNEMTGVVTRSEGEDPDRYIVIAPG